MNEQSRPSQRSQYQVVPQSQKHSIWTEATPCSPPIYPPNPCPPSKTPCNCGGYTQIITPHRDPVHRTSWALLGLSSLLFLCSLLSSFLLLSFPLKPVVSQGVGPVGPAGPQGPSGPAGPTGSQQPPAALW